jgi:hypothetical protein
MPLKFRKSQAGDFSFDLKNILLWSPVITSPALLWQL